MDMQSKHKVCDMGGAGYDDASKGLLRFRKHKERAVDVLALRYIVTRRCAV